MLWLRERNRIPVLAPARGDRPPKYEPVGWGVEDGEAFFYFDVPVGEWYSIVPNDCTLCLIHVTEGCVKGATFIEAKRVWSYPPDY